MNISVIEGNTYSTFILSLSLTRLCLLRLSTGFQEPITSKCNIEDAACRLLRNIGNYLSIDRASYHRRSESLISFWATKPKSVLLILYVYAHHLKILHSCQRSVRTYFWIILLTFASHHGCIYAWIICFTQQVLKCCAQVKNACVYNNVEY